MSFPLVGSPQRLAGARIFLKEPEGLSASADPLRLGGQAGMTEISKECGVTVSLISKQMTNIVYFFINICNPTQSLLGKRGA